VEIIGRFMAARLFRGRQDLKAFEAPQGAGRKIALADQSPDAEIRDSGREAPGQE
jgi:hypothetical protein